MLEAIFSFEKATTVMIVSNMVAVCYVVWIRMGRFMGFDVVAKHSKKLSLVYVVELNDSCKDSQLALDQWWIVDGSQSSQLRGRV